MLAWLCPHLWAHEEEKEMAAREHYEDERDLEAHDRGNGQHRQTPEDNGLSAAAGASL